MKGERERSHEELERWVSEHVDGELDGARRAELEAHLAGCAACRRLERDLRRLVQRARELGDPPPDPALWTRIEAALGAPRPRRAPRRPPVPWAAAAALFVAGFACAWLLRPERATPGERLTDAGPDAWLLLLHEPPGAALEPAAEAAAVAEYAAWARALAGEGRLVAGEKLADEPGWRLDPGGAPGGPLPSLDEAGGVAGYFVLRAPDRAAALALARGCPHLSHGGWIEVRRIDDV